MNMVVELSELQALADAGREAKSHLAPGARPVPPDNVVQLWNTCPHSEEVTEYDLRNIYLYGILLQAEDEGASERQMAETFFRIHVDRNPTWALSVVQTHLARAHWLKENVYPLLDW
jgi:hypothetical protein